MALDTGSDRRRPALRRWHAGARDAEAGRMAGVAKALGDPVRLALVEVLRDGARAVSDLVCLFDISQPAVSHHLGVLRRAGLVTPQRHGVWTYYSLVPDALAEYARWLAGGTTTTIDAPGAAPPPLPPCRESDHPGHVLFHSGHTWARAEGDEAVFGATCFTRCRWGEAVFVAAAPVGWTIFQHERFAVVESVTTVTDALAPLSGQVIAVNRSLVDRPETIDQDPYGEGWILRVRLSDKRERSALLDRKAYARLLDEVLDGCAACC